MEDDLYRLGQPTIDDVVSADDADGGGGYLLGHVLRFGQLLRLMGIDVSTRQVLDLVEALEHVAISDRFDFYTTCKALLVNRREDFLVFDQAFQLFWRMEEVTGADRSPLPDQELTRMRLPSKPASQEGAGEDEGEGQGEKSGEEEEEQERASRPFMVYSHEEVLRHKDFREMSWEEIQEAKRAIARLEWKLGERRTRRVRSSYKGRLNMRRMIRDNLRHGGEPIRLALRQRTYRPRSLVVLCDISGSMERYSRMLLHFIHSLAHSLVENHVEAFVFGTRLTRITRHLRSKDIDESLNELGEVVYDWSGGTRIGEALKTFNFRWARRVLGRGAVVLVISDGWDRGDLALLSREVFRLQRSSYRLIWLNPLLGSDEYRPIQRGMATVMPCVDDFMPVHNLVSLDQLAELLSQVTTMRPMRKQRLCAPEVEAQPEPERARAQQEAGLNRPWTARAAQVG